MPLGVLDVSPERFLYIIAGFERGEFVPGLLDEFVVLVPQDPCANIVPRRHAVTREGVRVRRALFAFPLSISACSRKNRGAAVNVMPIPRPPSPSSAGDP